MLLKEYFEQKDTICMMMQLIMLFFCKFHYTKHRTFYLLRFVAIIGFKETVKMILRMYFQNGEKTIQRPVQKWYTCDILDIM